MLSMEMKRTRTDQITIYGPRRASPEGVEPQSEIDGREVVFVAVIGKGQDYTPPPFAAAVLAQGGLLVREPVQTAEKDLTLVEVEDEKNPEPVGEPEQTPPTLVAPAEEAVVATEVPEPVKSSKRKSAKKD